MTGNDSATRELRAASAHAAGAPLQLRGLNVVDVIRGTTEKRTLVLANGKFADADDVNEDSTNIIDLDGYWACPSLIDMHAHVTFEPRAHSGVSFSFDQSNTLGGMRAVQNLTEALRSGICLVRDAGGRQANFEQLQRYINNGDLLLPELVTCGEPVCRPNGHGAAFGRHASPETFEEITTAHVAAGHEWLKIMNGPELWPIDELAKLISAAHAAGLRTAVHAFTSDGIRSAVLAGATTIEHGLVKDADLAAEARRRGTHFVPTAYCSWISLRSRYTYTQTPEAVEHLKYWFDYLELCRDSHVSSGLPSLLGTDAGCAPCTFDDYFEELGYFQRWGLEPMTVLQNATIRAATCLRREAQFGSIDLEKWANFIVTATDPTEDTTVLRHPAATFFKGAAVVNNLGELWP